MNTEFAYDLFRGPTGDITPQLLWDYVRRLESTVPMFPFDSGDMERLKKRIASLQGLQQTRLGERILRSSPEAGVYVATLAGAGGRSDDLTATLYILNYDGQRLVLFESRGFSFLARQEADKLHMLTVYDWCACSSDFKQMLEADNYEYTVKRLGSMEPLGQPNCSLLDGWYLTAINELHTSLMAISPERSYEVFQSILQFSYAYAVWLGESFIVIVVHGEDSAIVEMDGKGVITTLGTSQKRPWSILQRGFVFSNVTIPELGL